MANVSVNVHKLWFFWIWTVVYDGLPFLFDGWGIAKTSKSALNKAKKRVIRIARYENRSE